MAYFIGANTLTYLPEQQRQEKMNNIDSKGLVVDSV